MNKLRAGLIGMGSMGKNHARILSNLEGVDFVGAVDNLLQKSLNQPPSPVEIYSSIDELIKKRIDYCVIAVPTANHAEVAIKLLEFGVHCLIEKPITLDISDAYLIKQIADKESLIVGVGHIERYNPAIAELKKRIEIGEIGEIYEMSFKRQGPFPTRIKDVGVVKDLATHDIDTTLWLTGSKFQNVFAQTFQKKGSLFEDLVTINAKMQNSLLVNIYVNWVSPIKERQINVIGEKGMFAVDTLNSDLTFYENGRHKISQESLKHFKGENFGKVSKFAFEKPEPLLVEHENFRDAVLGKNAKIINLQDGIEVLRLAEAVLLSANVNQVITC